MRKSVLISLISFVILSLVGILNAQSLMPSPTGTWSLTGAMSQARSGAAAAAMSGGAVLVSGGTDANGVVLATAEIYGAKGSFTIVAPMNVPRTGHTATWLANTSSDSGGYVLVTGGASTGGVILASAELYDPTANTWTLLPSPMVVARTGHPATALPNSSVLLSGGTSGNTSSPVVLADLEQFGLTGQQFVFAGAMPTPRKAHAAAALQDGRVLIVGGTDANGNTLASTAIYDSTAGTVSSGPSLNTPRANATATTLLNGTVLIAGGTYPEGAAANANIAELQSAEIFDPVAGTITPTTAKLVQARAGHQAFLLTNNNNVLLVGGTYNGTDLASSELYTPWTGTFVATGTMSTARSSATGAALFPLADGQLLVAGGNNQQTDATGVVTTTTSNTGELYGFATIKTDAPDYAPGTPVIMTGTGWKPSETVSLYMVATPTTADTAPLTTTAADGGGNIMYGMWAPDQTDLGARFYLTAVGATSGAQAQNTFTDGSPTTTITIIGTGSVTETRSDTGETIKSCGGSCTYSNSGTPSATCTSGVCTVTWSANYNATLVANPGTNTFSGWSGTGLCTGQSTCAASANGNGDFAATATFLTSTTTGVASSANPSTYGTGVKFTATVSPSAATGTVTFLDGSTTLGTAR
jgi:N-acetylneuraminic acid mutarotase